MFSSSFLYEIPLFYYIFFFILWTHKFDRSSIGYIRSWNIILREVYYLKFYNQYGFRTIRDTKITNIDKCD